MNPAAGEAWLAQVRRARAQVLLVADVRVIDVE
jgi:hypothetical protein